MKKSTHAAEYEAVKSALIAMRKATGLTQRDLAKKLGREHSFVWRIENGERRVDLLEFYWICKALGEDAAQRYAGLIRSFRSRQNAANPVTRPRRTSA